MSSRSSKLAWSLRRLGWRVAMRWMRLRRRQTTVQMPEMIGFYEGIWREAARTLGADMEEVRQGLWRIRRGASSTLIDNYVVQLDDPVILEVAGDKALCHRLLSERGLPVPEHAVFKLADFDVAERFVERHRGSCFVVKPAAGTSGARGVTTHIEDARECRRASALASIYGNRILIERWVAGESYRLLFLDGEMIHASRRRGTRIVGDGHSTIAELIDRDQTAGVPSRAKATVRRDERATLQAQGLHLHSVPEPGRSLLVRSASEPVIGTVQIRTVFDEDATPLIGPALREQAAQAVAALGSRFAGVDLITLDPALPLEATGGVINEINTTPGLHHHYGLDGIPEDIMPAVRVLARLLDADARVSREPARLRVSFGAQTVARSR